MTVTPLGLVTVAAAGTPVQITADTTIVASAIIISAKAGSGRVFFGKAGMVKATGVGVIREINPTAANGRVDEWRIEASSNKLHPSDFYIDGTANGDGAYVAYATI